MLGGAIFLSMGPSGAGKDTLLLGAREVLAGDDSVCFVKRHITRSPDKVTDVEVPVTVEYFLEQQSLGNYAFSWDAHGTKYAIPRTDLENGLLLRQRLILNVSRTIVDEVLEQYGQQRGVDVYALNITASEHLLRARLGARGRESADEIENRVRRAKAMEPQGGHVIHIFNDTSVVDGIQRVVDALKNPSRIALAQSHARKVLQQFKVYDDTSSGLIQATHLGHVLSTLCPAWTGEDVHNILSLAPKEQEDGSVNYTEFLQAIFSKG